jgi:hypothetical protein
MRILFITTITISLLFACQAYSDNNHSLKEPKVLFVYENVDLKSKFIVESFREQLKKADFYFEEDSLGSKAIKDLSNYQYIIIYSGVMAFNTISPVRKWMRSTLSFENEKIFIFVTANRWYYESHLKELVNLAEQRHGTVVDAVSMATCKMSESQKIEKIQTHLSKLIH